MYHRVPGVPKRTHLSWASQGSYIACSKLHMLALAFSVLPVCYIVIHALSLLPFVVPPENYPLYPGLLAFWTATYTIQSCTHFILAYLDPRTKIRQIHWFPFLSGSASHNFFWISRVPGQLNTWFKGAHTLSCLTFLLQQKIIIGKFILARICSPEILLL